jgi:hypothetical protein
LITGSSRGKIEKEKQIEIRLSFLNLVVPVAFHQLGRLQKEQFNRNATIDIA